MSENNEKSLGQVACEAYFDSCCSGNVPAWNNVVSTVAKSAWEAAAQAVADHVRASVPQIDLEHHTIIDRRLLERMPYGQTRAFAVVCFDGSGFISNDFDPFASSGTLCGFDKGFDTSTYAMKKWLNEHEKPAWGWPVPTDADRGKLVYFSDTQSWCGPRPLLGVVDGEFPFVTGRVAPQGWRYAVLADPDNPDARPPEDLVPEPTLPGEVKTD